MVYRRLIHHAMIDLWLTDQSGPIGVSKITGRYGLGLLQRQNESNHGDHILCPNFEIGFNV